MVRVMAKKTKSPMAGLTVVKMHFHSLQCKGQTVISRVHGTELAYATPRKPSEVLLLQEMMGLESAWG